MPNHAHGIDRWDDATGSIATFCPHAPASRPPLNAGRPRNSRAHAASRSRLRHSSH